MVHAGAAYGGWLTMLALSGQRGTWTTAVLAYAATSSLLEPGSSRCAELHYWACRITEYYQLGGRMPLGIGAGGDSGSRE